MPGLSYEHCGGSQPLIGETIGQCLRRIAQEFPDNDLIVSVDQGMRFTYREFDDIVNRAAKAFLELGIRRGDRVALWSINNYEWVVTQFATARIGAVLVNVNPAYRTHEFEYVLKESQVKSLILLESFKSSKYAEMFYKVCPEAKECEPGRIESWRFPHLKSVICIGSEQLPGMLTTRSFAELGDDYDAEELRAIEDELDFDDIINIQYTSGTTGFPKGVLLTHHNILNNAYSISGILGTTNEDRLCVPVPFYHCFGMVISVLGCVTRGATLVVPGPIFEPESTLRAVQDERCTMLHGVPTMFVAELAHPDFDKFDVSHLRTGIMAGAPCPVELMKKVISKMNMKGVSIAYGQTEASPVTTLTRPDDSIERRVSTVGRTMPHQELKIIDAETGKIVPRGMPGEICFRGYNVMAGYDHNPEATAQTIDERAWLHSGDVGDMDDDGYVRITGRIKNMVIRGGENIYPREIEEFLFTLDMVVDAQVLGVPDEKFGEELLACVKLKDEHKDSPPTPAEFAALCKGSIAHFKVPRYWKVVDEFPMTVTGKVQKFKLREMAEREMGEGTLPDARAK